MPNNQTYQFELNTSDLADAAEVLCERCRAKGYDTRNDNLNTPAGVIGTQIINKAGELVGYFEVDMRRGKYTLTNFDIGNIQTRTDLGALTREMVGVSKTPAPLAERVRLEEDIRNVSGDFMGNEIVQIPRPI